MGWGGGATGWWRYPTYRKFAYCFPHPPSPGRFQGHFTDKGYNAIQLAYAANCWVRNVRIQNADNGLLVSSTNFVTVDGECGWCCQHLVLAGNGSQPAVERQMRPAVGLVGTACYQGHRNRARRAFQEAAEQAACDNAAWTVLPACQLPSCASLQHPARRVGVHHTTLSVHTAEQTVCTHPQPLPAACMHPACRRDCDH